MPGANQEGDTSCGSCQVTRSSGTGCWLLRKLKEAQKRWAEPACTEGVGGASLPGRGGRGPIVEDLDLPAGT